MERTTPAQLQQYTMSPIENSSIGNNTEIHTTRIGHSFDRNLQSTIDI